MPVCALSWTTTVQKRASELIAAGYSMDVISDQLHEEFDGIDGGGKTGGIDGKYLDGSIAPNGILAGTQSHSHDYKETGRTAATCTEEGKITYTCDCGKTKTEAISKVEHDYQQSEETKGTCLEIGKIKFACNNCGDSYYVETEYAPHNYIPSDESTQPTCTEDGMQIMTCSVCNDKNTSTIPALGHEESPVATLKTAPTCEAEGLEQYLCTRCNNVLREEVLLATGHTKAEMLTVIKEPSILTEGTGVCKCTVCDTVLETTTIPQKDFPYVVVMTTNILGYMLQDSDWFVLEAGDNVFTYDAESGNSNLHITFTTTLLYSGV